MRRGWGSQAHGMGGLQGEPETAKERPSKINSLFQGFARGLPCTHTACMYELLN